MNTTNEVLLRRVTAASVLVAILLIAAKLVAWFITGSVAILASLVDSLMDVAASTINFFAIRLALEPPDDEHRFGHGKIEAIAGLAQTAFIIGSASFLLLQASSRFFDQQHLQATDVGIGVMIFSTLATAGLLIYQRHVIRITNSDVVKADALHYLSDILGNAAVIVALLLSQIGWGWADPVAAIIVALYIMHSAWYILRSSIDQLIDRELPLEETQKIEGLIRSHPEVKGIHQLRTRRAGQRYLIQFHLELDGSLSLNQSHEIADTVERELMTAYPGADVISHQDPVG